MKPVYFDLIIAAIVAISALWGRHKGFVLTLCGFLAIFVALIGSAVLTNLLAQPLSSLAVPFIENHINTILETSVAEFCANTEAAIIATLDEVLALLGNSELLNGLTGSIVRAVQEGSLDVSGDALRSVIHYVAEQLTRLVLFPVFFVLLLLVWTALSHILDLAFHAPGLNFLNRTTGLILGFARGLLLVFILCWLLKDSYITPEVLDSTFLLPYFCGENPLLDISILNS